MELKHGRKGVLLFLQLFLLASTILCLSPFLLYHRFNSSFLALPQRTSQSHSTFYNTLTLLIIDLHEIIVEMLVGRGRSSSNNNNNRIFTCFSNDFDYDGDKARSDKVKLQIPRDFLCSMSISFAFRLDFYQLNQI